jgi:hypothetical protein
VPNTGDIKNIFLGIGSIGKNSFIKPQQTANNNKKYEDEIPF